MTTTAVNTNNNTANSIIINCSFAFGSVAIVSFINSVGFASLVKCRSAPLTSHSLATLDSIQQPRLRLDYYYHQHRRWGGCCCHSNLLLIRLRLLRTNHNITPHRRRRSHINYSLRLRLGRCIRRWRRRMVIKTNHVLHRIILHCNAILTGREEELRIESLILLH